MAKVVEFDSDLSDQIVSLKNDGKKWNEISKAVDMPPGKCMLIFEHATVRPKDVIKNPTGADVARLRDEENVSWGVISARTRRPETWCRKVYEEETGRSTRGLRIGKGGRHPGGGGGSKPTPKKKAAAAGPAEQPLADLSNDDVKEAMTGYAVKVLTNDGEDIVKVAGVTRVTKTTVVVKDETGAARTLKRDAVFQISKKKVIKGS